MKKSNLKQLEINLRPASTLPDLTCTDGEVEQFRNVDWLKSQIKDTTSNPANPDNSSGSSGSTSTTLSLSNQLQSTILPYGSTLLTIHSPAALHGDRRLLILTSPDSLAILKPSDGQLSYIAGSVSTRFGNILRALTYGDFILLITEKGIHWIIFNPSSLQYQIAEANPEAPQVEFNLTPVALPGYTSTAGGWPKLEVAVDIPLSMGVSEAMFHNWLDGGSSSAVSEDVRLRVHQAVGKAVAEYEAAIAARGLFLTSPRCLASFDGVLPSYPQFPKTDSTNTYSTPCARLFSWGYHAEKLTLILYFSLLPMQLSVKFTIPQEQRVWTARFDSLEVAVTPAPAWHDSGKSLSATAYTSYTDPSTQTRDGFAFRFEAALSPAELHGRACRSEDYKVIERNRLSGAVEGVITLINPAALPSSSLSSFTPRYADLTIPEATDAQAVDQGFILFGGNAELRDVDGSRRRISLDQSILGSHRDFPFVFRHLCHVGDGSIRGVAQANGSRATGDAGRHPLHVLSADGIRLLAADGSGGYLNSRLLSRSGVRADYPIALGSETVYFMSADGLCSLAINSTLKEFDKDLPAADWTNMEVLGNDEALVLSAPGIVTLFDLRQKKEFPQPDTSFRTLFRYQGEVIATDSAGRIMSLRPLRTSLSETVEPADETQPESEDRQSQPSEGASLSDSDIFDPRDAYILTRPLKLGTPFERKRIRGIALARPDISLILEASDNLTDWIELCRHIAPPATDPPQPATLIKGLRLPSFRYYRLHASAPQPRASHLAAITLYLP